MERKQKHVINIVSMTPPRQSDKGCASAYFTVSAANLIIVHLSTHFVFVFVCIFFLY